MTSTTAEETHTSRSERLLAVVLAAFVLVGLLWIYARLDEVPSRPARASAAQQGVLKGYERADFAAALREGAVVETRDELVLARERYRTALDAGRPARKLERRYRRAEDALADATRQSTSARAELARIRPRAVALQRSLDERFSAQERARGRIAFALRFIFVFGVLAFALLLMGRMRRRGSAYQVIALALVGAAGCRRSCSPATTARTTSTSTSAARWPSR